MNAKTNISPSQGQLTILYKVVDALIGTGNVRVVFEFGSRYGEDTVELAKKYNNATVYSFECNPKSLPALKERVKPFTNILFTEKALLDHNGVIEFYQINEEKTRTTWVDGNQGASSVFKASGKYPVEEYSQNVIKVEAITLESFMQNNKVSAIDIMWVDIQGAELKALEGMGLKINALKIIHLEVEFIEIYKGQPLFSAVDAFLKNHNFHQLGFTSKTHYSGDVIYINNRYFDQANIDAVADMTLSEDKSFSFYFSRLMFKFKYLGFRIKKVLFHSSH